MTKDVSLSVYDVGTDVELRNGKEAMIARIVIGESKQGRMEVRINR